MGSGDFWDVCGGEWATRYAANNERLQLKAMAIALACFAVVSGLIYLSSNLYVALALTGWPRQAGA